MAVHFSNILKENIGEQVPSEYALTRADRGRRSADEMIKFGVILAFMFGAANVVLSIVRAFKWPYWAYHALAVSVGLILYVTTTF